MIGFPPRRVTLFTRPDCTLCHAAEYVIRRVALEIPLELCTVNIDEPGQQHWHEAYDHEIPVVHIDGVEHARHRVNERALRAALGRAETTGATDS